MCVVAANKGAAVGILVPTYKNAEVVWNAIGDMCWPCGDVIRANRSSMRWTFPSGGYIQFFTDENATAIRGNRFHLFCIDEAAQIRRNTYYQAIRPTLADYSGRCFAFSTPLGRNWFYEEWIAGNDPLVKSVTSFHAPTTANPHPNIQADYYEQLERLGPDNRDFRQEWMAEFLEEGSVFRGIRAASVLEPRERVHGHQYAFGVDWGRSNDFTAVSVFDITACEQVCLDRFTAVEFPVQLNRIQGLNNKYRPIVIKAEENSIGKPQIENMRRMGLPVQPFHTTNASKAQLVDHLSLQLETGAIKLLKDSVQIAELEAYEAKQMSTGFRYSAPDGMHDDTVMALMLAVWAGKSRRMSTDQRQRIAELTSW